MKNKIKKFISVALTVLTIISVANVTALAASTGSDANNPSVGEDVVQNAHTEYEETEIGRTSTDVFLTVDDSDVLVAVPTSVIVSGTPSDKGEYIGNYSVKASGDISGEEVLSVSPKEANISLQQKGKDDISAEINQDQTIFASSDLAEGVSSNGTVTANSLTAGTWHGTSSFEIQLTSSYSLYSSLELAAADANNLTTENADVLRENADDAVCGLFPSGNKAYIRMFKDEANVGSIDLNQNTEMNLNTHTITFSDGDYLNSNADLSVYNGKINCNNSQYAVNETSEGALLVLSSLDIVLNGNETNNYGVYSKAIKNDFANCTMHITNASDHLASGVVLNTSDDSVNKFVNCNFNVTSLNGGTRSIQTTGNTVIESGSYTVSGNLGSPLNIHNTGNLTINDGTFSAECHESMTACIYNSGTAVINGGKYVVSSTKNSAYAFYLTSGNTKINHANISAYGEAATAILCRANANLNIESANKSDVFVYGEAYGLTTSNTGLNTIKGGTYTSDNHVVYIMGNAEFQNALIYSCTNNEVGLVYCGDDNCPVDATVTFSNCIFGDSNVSIQNHRFCIVSQTNYGYQDPSEINIYDCHFYSGSYSIFSYNGPGINQTKFNIYGDTHFYKSYDTETNQWVEYNKDEVANLLTNWKQTIYANNSVGNKLVMSYGNGTVEDGIVISIPIKNDANVYDYR